jgi:hypothetical protein
VTNETAEFVVLEHTAPDGVHWDLMLQDTGTLLTWRLAVSPQEIGSGPIQIQRIFDHPLRFLTYEGPVQANTGAVKRIDKGLCRWIEKSQTACTACLSGTVLRGCYQVTQQGSGPQWVMVRP